MDNYNESSINETINIIIKSNIQSISTDFRVLLNRSDIYNNIKEYISNYAKCNNIRDNIFELEFKKSISSGIDFYYEYLSTIISEYLLEESNYKLFNQTVSLYDKDQFLNKYFYKLNIKDHNVLHNIYNSIITISAYNLFNLTIISNKIIQLKL